MIQPIANPEFFELFSPQIKTLVPFADRVDPSRLNMTSKQLTQTCVSKKTDTPFIIDKYYEEFSTISSPYSEMAEDDGVVIFREDNLLIVYYTTLKKLMYKYIPNFKKLINNSLSLKYCVKQNGTFKKGDLLFDYTNMIPELNMPRIGYRTDIMMGNFFGFIADDAMLISESFAAKTQTEYSEKVFLPVTKRMRFLKRANEGKNYLPTEGSVVDENFLSYYNIDMDEFFLTEIINMDEVSESKYYTKTFKGIDKGTVDKIKIHKLTESSFLEKRSEYLYTSELIDELEYYSIKQDTFKNKLISKFKALKIPYEKIEEMIEDLDRQYIRIHDCPKPILNDMRDKYNVDPEEIDFLIEIDFSYISETTKGDKFANLFAGKGTVSLILPEQLMPINPKTGKPFDMIFNPLGIFGRNNWGSIFELAMSKCIRDVEKADFDGKIKRLNFINETIIKLTDKEYYETVRTILNSDPKNIIESIEARGLYLFFSNFNNITYYEFIETFVKPYEIEFGINISKKEKIKIDKKLMVYLREYLEFDSTIFKKASDNIYETEIDAYYGENYILKLHHTSNSKYNSVAFTNSYSKTTGQPAKGRKNNGGQHLSWQSTCSLLSHKENNSILKELFTFKSDSMEDKETFLMKIIKDGKYNLKDKYHSGTKKTINNALKMIGMEFE